MNGNKHLRGKSLYNENILGIYLVYLPRPPSLMGVVSATREGVAFNFSKSSTTKKSEMFPRRGRWVVGGF
jgi:hypothetical protein